jgi:hypothetical protein
VNTYKNSYLLILYLITEKQYFKQIHSLKIRILLTIYIILPQFLRYVNLILCYLRLKKGVDSTSIKEDKNGLSADELNKIFHYYSSNTKYNHLDEIIDKKYINVIDMNEDHFSWINSYSKISSICKEL